MRKLFAACFAASLLIICVATSLAAAAPTEVAVRIEGREETLFEGTVPVSVRKVRASSDSQERDCDGINELDPGNVVPRATPTLAAAEAMGSVGESFDGQWYEGFGDYFITRWGPDSQDAGAGAYWGVLVNQVYTSVGGCQLQLGDGDEVLWVWDAFGGRPTLALYPADAHYSAGPRPTAAVAQRGQPFAVEVVSFPDGGEGIPGDGPSRAGSSPYVGAEVAPVATSAKGFQRVDATSPQAVETDSQGRATLVFSEPGIHRIKATVGAPGAEAVVRSNGLAVCVPAAFGDCGEAGPVAGPGGPATSSARPAAGPGPGAGTKPGRGPRLAGRPKLDRSMLAQGRLGISWTVLDAGGGIARWQVSSKTAGRKRAGFIVRASGKSGTRASLRLPRGATYLLRLSLTDVSGQTTIVSLGRVTVPHGAAS